MARPKSEGFVRKAEAKRRVKASKPKLTPNARYVQTTRYATQRAVTNHRALLAKKGVKPKPSNTKAEARKRRKKINSVLSQPDVRKSFGEVLNAVKNSKQAVKDNQLNFQRMIGTPQVPKVQRQRRYTVNGSIGKIPLVGSRPRKKVKPRSPYAPKRYRSYSPPSRFNS